MRLLPGRKSVAVTAAFWGLMAASILFLSEWQKSPDYVSLEEIMAAGELTVITRNTSHCYYHYRDQAMGFEYDLAAAFAEYLGVALKVRIADRWEGMIPDLMNGRGALIAASMTITPSRKRQVAFSESYLEVQQHLIVHRKNAQIRSVKDLNGKVVHVRKGTSYQDHLERIKAEGIALEIRLHEDVPTEELIAQVAEGRIGITIADSNIAFRNRRYFPGIVVSDPIGPSEQLGWAVPPRARRLREKINAFFHEIRSNGTFQRIYNRYYSDIDHFDYVDLRRYHRRIKSRLPRYLPIIQEAARKNDFDWRLIAAQIYQESHFDPQARSHAGAYGLMQLTRATAKSHGVKNIFDAAENINAGVAHLNELYALFDQAQGSNRLFIALAAYNIGQGHIMDARNLARKMNLDPDRWASLAKTLPMLSRRTFYKNAAYGFCRGNEPVEYVRQIMIYFDILRYQGIEYQT